MGSDNEQGLIVKDLVSEDSYYYKYETWEKDVFPAQLPFALVVDRTYQYSDSEMQTKITNLTADAQSNVFFNSNRSLSGLNAYMSATSFYRDSSEADFVSGLRLFLQEPQYQLDSNDVVLDGDTITASRVYVFTSLFYRKRFKLWVLV